jgi:anti-sigma regulatory factor (Ser/Thr protein kinase)
VTGQRRRPAGRAVIRTQLASALTAPGQARVAVRRALASWDLDALAPDAELLASELVANAAEHAGGRPINLTIRQHQTRSGLRGVECEVTDRSRSLPQPRAADQDSERGRGLAIVATLATSNGVTLRPNGKTTWFTLTSPRAGPESEPELEAGG